MVDVADGDEVVVVDVVVTPCLVAAHQPAPIITIIMMIIPIQADVESPFEFKLYHLPAFLLELVGHV